MTKAESLDNGSSYATKKLKNKLYLTIATLCLNLLNVLKMRLWVKKWANINYRQVMYQERQLCLDSSIV